MRLHAQEHSDAVLWKHVELYVSDETRALSATGRGALRALEQHAIAAGLASPAGGALDVLG
jgi:predicted solute-binding protein